jgi:hypothetical protein
MTHQKHDDPLVCLDSCCPLDEDVNKDKKTPLLSGSHQGDVVELTPATAPKNELISRDPQPATFVPTPLPKLKPGYVPSPVPATPLGDRAAAKAAMFAKAGEQAAARGVPHPGVQCDASGQMPIKGWRFHLTGDDHDLCEAEWLKLSPSDQARFEKIAPGNLPKAVRAKAKERAAEQHDAAVAKGARLRENGFVAHNATAVKAPIVPNVILGGGNTTGGNKDDDGGGGRCGKSVFGCDAFLCNGCAVKIGANNLNGVSVGCVCCRNGTVTVQAAGLGFGGRAQLCSDHQSSKNDCCICHRSAGSQPMGRWPAYLCHSCGSGTKSSSCCKTLNKWGK